MSNGIGLGRTPAVFISSTCYDLKQIRANLKDFIEKQFSFDAVLSEHDSFPIDTNIGTVENCIRAVRERADIFVLVVGGRYGNITDSGKSVTNLEYINARAKGIPVYAFVDKGLLNVLPIWKSNPSADFSSVVDTSKLFEFVDSLRGKENMWVYGFETAQDIINTLKRQIGYLLYDSLSLRQRLQSKKLSAKIMQLEGTALNIAIEKPAGWEYLLLGKIMENRFQQAEDLKRDLIYSISFGRIKQLTDSDEIINWLSIKSSELLLMADALSSLFNKAIPVAVGAYGEPGDVDHIVYVAERIGDIYEGFIKWGLEFKTISVDEDWQGVVYILSKTWESPINDLDKYCDKYRQAMNRIASIPEVDEEPITLDLTLTLTEPDLTEFNRELDKVGAKYGVM
ncbi:MAG: DUF4062 domain-containing protein [Syntrophomonas sp.]